MGRFETKEDLYTVLDDMVRRLQESERFKGLIARSDITVNFNLTDLAAEYTLTLQRGEVKGAPGKAPNATVGLSMSSAVFDEIFTGKRDAEYAYMSGVLSLQGSEYTAQSLLPYVRDMTVAYKDATA